MTSFRLCCVLWLAALLAGCGKVGAPLPPFVRIPQDVQDLAVRQDGYNVVLSWTNPARYIDGTLARDLSEVHVFANGQSLQTIPVTEPGQAQSLVIDVRGSLGTRRTYTLTVATIGGRFSRISNEAAIETMDVPGTVQNVSALVDQGRIRIEWDVPTQNPSLAHVYLVQRSDRSVGEYVMNLQYEDADFQAGQSYSYRVTALRRDPSVVPGTGGVSIDVVAVDQTPPQSPMDVQATPSGDGILLTWAPGDERDLAGYRVARSVRADGDFTPVHADLHTTNAFFDGEFDPGMYYSISAVDDLGNSSTPHIVGAP